MVTGRSQTKPRQTYAAGAAVDRRTPGQEGYVVARAVRLDHHRAGVLPGARGERGALLAGGADDRHLERTAGTIVWAAASDQPANRGAFSASVATVASASSATVR